MKVDSRHRLTCFALALALQAGACGKKQESAAGGEHAEEGGEHKEGEQEGVLKLTPEQVRSAGIATVTAEARTHAGVLEATAEIQAAENRQARVGARVAGRVTALRAGAGDAVRAGSVLAVVDSPDVGRAKADYIAAVAGARVARESADRERALYDKRISSEKDWREAEAQAIRAETERNAAENRLHALGVGDAELARVRREGHYSSTTAVTAPIAGTVVERSATLGQMVDPATPLFLIMDLREVWILVDVHERDLGQVHVGQAVHVRIPAFEAQQFPGRVASVGSVIETKTRTAKVRVVLPNPAMVLKPGMFAAALFEGTVGTREHPAVFVPVDALQKEDERTIVFVARGTGEFEAREVTAGHVSQGFVEIEKGLSAVETVVTTGAFVLKSELKKAELGEADHH